MTARPSPFSLMTAAVAVAALALAAAGSVSLTRALDRLKDQSRIELAMSLQRQFDGDFKLDRADVARAFLYPDRPRKGKKKAKGLETSPYPYLMDFFDDLGYLVERGSVDETMAERYFGYYLDHYFEATEKLLREDLKKDPARFEHLFRLVERWRGGRGEDKLDLDHFFQHELDFADPAPLEGPHT
jgi:hypothetical protein